LLHGRYLLEVDLTLYFAFLAMAFGAALGEERLDEFFEVLGE